jgi:hypothetical protein
LETRRPLNAPPAVPPGGAAGHSDLRFRAVRPASQAVRPALPPALSAACSPVPTQIPEEPNMDTPVDG